MTTEIADTEALIANLPADKQAEFWRLLSETRPKTFFTDPKFSHQTAFILDTAKFKGLIGTRRSGKSLALVLLLLMAANAQPDVSCLYVALTRDNAKKAIWQHGFKWYARLHPELGLVFNETELSVRLPNRSVIYLMGGESSTAVAERLRGGKFPLIVVDEAGTFGARLRPLFAEILRPAVLDYSGTICISGTPGFLKTGLFYDLTCDQPNQPPRPNPGRWTTTDKESGSEWSIHRWRAEQNPYTCDQAIEAMVEMRRVNPQIDQIPSFIREWLGGWVTDDTNFVYRWDPIRNGWDGKLPATSNRVHFILSVDLGFNDPCSFTVLAYVDHDPHLYILSNHTEQGMIVPDMEKHIKTYPYKFDTIVADGANKQAIEDLRQRMNVPLVIAQKMDKAVHIEMMNADFITGTIKVNVTACPQLVHEYETLIWDVDVTDKKVELQSLENDACDSALYGWRRASNFRNKPLDKGPAYGTPQYLQAQASEAQMQAIRDVSRDVHLRDKAANRIARANQRTGGNRW